MAAQHWSEQLADEVQQRWDGEGPIVCASGISPSGPIHLGNLREVLTTHLVAEALRRRDLPVRHLHSWDDYDRLRKVPAGVDPSFAEHVGRPLAAVPDPQGELASWADRFMGPFLESLERLGVEIHGVRQSECYPRGDYNAAIRTAMDARARVFDVLAEQQTAGRHSDPVEERRARYYPFKPFCEACGKDETQVTGWDTPVATYTCHACGNEGSMSIADGERISGKLVWKVDWPMRWAHERVLFEPAGEDHHAPTGSFTVGGPITSELYGWQAPATTVYSFVSLSGVGGKMSGSAGDVVTPGRALGVFEPEIIRWPYVQRLPSASFGVDFSPKGVQRQYDHWDQFVAENADSEVRRLTSETTSGRLDATPRPVSFRLLASVADLTQGNREQIGRIVAEHLDVPADGLVDELEPRLGCAITYATELVPEADRTVVRDAFAAEEWAALDADTQDGVRLLAAGLEDDWTVDGLTALVYGVPKRQLGLPDDTDPTPELKARQKAFFRALYRLLIGRDRGPRLPTLLLSIGRERAAALLTAPA